MQQPSQDQMMAEEAKKSESSSGSAGPMSSQKINDFLQMPKDKVSLIQDQA
jgi:hypothetical protein